MARPRAADYDDKRIAILGRAAGLFAGAGFERATMAAVAEACGVSKALLYHYYRSKEDVLFDILALHLDRLADALGSVEPGPKPRRRFRALVAAYVAAIDAAPEAHAVLLAETGALPAARQAEARARQQSLLDLFAAALREASPALASRPDLVEPVALAGFAMIDARVRAARPGPALPAPDFAALVSTLLLDGTRKLAD